MLTDIPKDSVKSALRTFSDMQKNLLEWHVLVTKVIHSGKQNLGNQRDDTVTQGSAFGSQKGRESVNRHLQTGKILSRLKPALFKGRGESLTEDFRFSE